MSNFTSIYYTASTGTREIKSKTTRRGRVKKVGIRRKRKRENVRNKNKTGQLTYEMLTVKFASVRIGSEKHIIINSAGASHSISSYFFFLYYFNVNLL